MIETLGSVISRPQFKQWEVNDRRSSLSEDLIQAEASPTSVVLEGLHQVAYRSVNSPKLHEVVMPQHIILKMFSIAKYMKGQC